MQEVACSAREHPSQIRQVDVLEMKLTLVGRGTVQIVHHAARYRRPGRCRVERRSQGCSVGAASLNAAIDVTSTRLGNAKAFPAAWLPWRGGRWVAGWNR